MSALARWFEAQNWAVFGSDEAGGKWVRELQKDGLYVKIGHKRDHIRPGLGLVVYNQAISETNPELKEARRLGIPTLTYPEMLEALTTHYATFAVAGAHGKSTTTSLLSLVLMKAGFDPTVIVGTKLKEFGNRNFRAGKSRNLIIEADEFKGSFWRYSPTYAIVTNIDREHLDFYKNLANVKKSFLRFIKNMREGGPLPRRSGLRPREGGILVLNRDDKNLLSLKNKIQKIAKKQKLKILWYGVTSSSRSRVICNKVKRVLRIPGQHNLSNALAVYKLARALGIKENTILKAIGNFKGTWRRFEYRGNLKIKNWKLKIPVYDDYAHHPTEIRATLAAFREKYPKHKLICVFQPHQAKRLKLLFKDFIHAFDETDYLILLPIYEVAGRDRLVTSNKQQVTSKNLAKLIPRSVYLANPNALKNTIQKIVIENYKLKIKNSVVVMMGAGTISEFTSKLLK